MLRAPIATYTLFHSYVLLQARGQNGCLVLLVTDSAKVWNEAEVAGTIENSRHVSRRQERAVGPMRPRPRR